VIADPERFVPSAKECTDRFILFGERSLEHVLREWSGGFYTHERNRQGRQNTMLLPRPGDRLGGLLRHYRRAA